MSEIWKKMYFGLHVKYPLFCPILMKRGFSRKIFEKYSNSKFHENPSSGSRVVPCGQTWRSKYSLIAILRKRLKLWGFRYGVSQFVAHLGRRHRLVVDYRRFGTPYQLISKRQAVPDSLTLEDDLVLKYLAWDGGGEQLRLTTCLTRIHTAWIRTKHSRHFANFSPFLYSFSVRNAICVTSHPHNNLEWPNWHNNKP